MRHPHKRTFDRGALDLRRLVLGTAALLGLLLSGPHLGAARAATGLLENPAPGSSQSGITVISGWVCDADTVTITVDGTQVLEAAYGTPRGDTRPTCGDNNNGFGLLWNFNLFGAGQHTLQAAADGVPIGDPITVDVVLVGDQPFERNLSGSYARAQFPTAGSSFRLLWQEGSQNFVIAPVDAVVAPPNAATSATAAVESPQATPVGALENPGDYASGIWLFSGWVCDANRVTIVVDGTTTIRAGYGTPRQDTLGTCGDTDNGFGVLWNFNLFGPGEHTVEARADGMPIGEAKTFIVKTFGEPFVRDAEKTYRLRNFPDSLNDVFVTWQQSSQNFAISSKVATGSPSPTPAPTGTPSPTPIDGPTPTGGGTTPTPTPTSTGGATPTPTPTPGGGLCGNGVINPGEQCDGANLNGFTCETAYVQFGEVGDCPGSTGLACDPDCTFNSEDPDACTCSCEGDIDCAFPDAPEETGPPIGIDCTQLWCNKGACPCDAEDGDEVFESCVDANLAACEGYAECVDSVGCFIGFDPNSFYFYSTQNGICGESQPGRCDTDAELYTMTDELRRIICTSEDPDVDDFRCIDYCDACDCTDPESLTPYDPDTGECS